MSDPSGRYPHFRLDFEQQQKRAKELLKAAREGDAAALQRLASTGAVKPGTTTPKLASAQLAIARELRFADWAALKHHLAAMAHEREVMPAGDDVHRDSSSEGAPDDDCHTLHIRCGSDIRDTLQEAGFRGDFHEHSYPYLIGPVREAGEGVLEQRAAFIAQAYDSPERPLPYEDVLASLREAEKQLADSANYERVVIWSERDVYDQLVLVRLLGHYATHRRPPRLELINVADQPGSRRFLGLGQLPPESLRLLWRHSRESATEAQLQLGLAAWRALASPDPRALAALARGGTPELPLLAPALLRHLAELPSMRNGLSFTEGLALAMLAQEPHSLNRLFSRMTWELDPLPGQGDSQMRDRVLDTERAREPVFTRVPGVDHEGRSRAPWTDVLTITDLGRRVLAGTVDFRSLAPPPRWVGGVHVQPDQPTWRWDESRREVEPERVPPTG